MERKNEEMMENKTADEGILRKETRGKESSGFPQILGQKTRKRSLDKGAGYTKCDFGSVFFIYYDEILKFVTS